jgi:hypothetical protein
MTDDDMNHAQAEIWRAQVRDIKKRGRLALSVAKRQAQERRAKEWEAYCRGGPVPMLTDAEVRRLYLDIFGES